MSDLIAPIKEENHQNIEEEVDTIQSMINKLEQNKLINIKLPRVTL